MQSNFSKNQLSDADNALQIKFLKSVFIVECAMLRVLLIKY